MPRLLLTTLLLAATLFVAAPPTAEAAFCRDYPNQAAAQEAKDTLDGDGDGIFCEAIPCPCSPEWHMQHGPDPAAPNPSTPRTSDGRTRVYHGRITRVVDGDTLHVKVKKQTKKVRVIGIDTPEPNKPDGVPECGSAEATSAAIHWSFKRRSDRNRDGLVDAWSGGRTVKLRTDPTQDLTDKYGRLLAYVGRGSKDFGKAQVAAGWAELFVFQNNPFKRVGSYAAKRDQARAAARGIWNLCSGNFHSGRQ